MPRIAPPKILDAAGWSQIQEVGTYSNEVCAVIADDATRALKRVPDETVNTCLTSPPYWGVRDYDHDDQLGHEKTAEEYAERLVEVFDEVKRVLTPDGTAWLNLGDSYFNGCGVNGKVWRRNKQLALVPFRVALALQDAGWWVRNALVWHKPNAMPSSVRDRLTNTWEPVFLLSKAEQYYFNLDNVRVPHKTDDGVERRRADSGHTNGKAKGQKNLRRWLNSPRHRATIDGKQEVRRRPGAPDPVDLAAYLRTAAAERGVSIKWVAEQLNQPFERVRHYFRTDRIGSRLPPEDTWEELKTLLDLGTEFDDAMEIEIGDNVFRNHPMGRNPGDVQSFALSGGGTPHFATMPESLARWTLQASLPAGGLCLDPFMGMGTTGKVAIEQGGRFLGVELNDTYARAAFEDLAEGQLVLSV